MSGIHNNYVQIWKNGALDVHDVEHTRVFKMHVGFPEDKLIREEL